MKWTYTVNGSKVTITDRDFLAAGGEAQVFVKDDLAYKIYHDPSYIIPAAKLKELQAITAANVLKPQHFVYDSAGVPVGFVMDYKKDVHPLCKLFTKAFKIRNGISNEMITALVEELQNTIANDIHAAKCLVVDLNELNILVSADFKRPFFIDVDSYQTPSYKATAIMESIRDRRVKDNHWTQSSDWFSFAVLAFQLWIGIHPYKGSHPAYKPNEWLKRMEDGVSVLDPKASLPPACGDYSLIPASHMEWFRRIFLKNERCSPPRIGDAGIIIGIPATFKVITSSDMFVINRVEECLENIIDVFNYIGVNYMIGTKAIHRGKIALPVEVIGYSKVLMCEADSAPVVCKLKDEMVEFEDTNGKAIGKIAANDMMYRNGCIYTVRGEKVMENTFAQYGEKIIHATRHAGNVLGLSTKVFDGVIFQNLLGKTYMTLPYQKGKCTTMPVKELDGYRILDARSERNICGVMAEKGGVYSCFILTFNATYSNYTLRVNKDVPYSEINLTVLPNGIAVMANNSTCEIFKDGGVKVIDNPPFNSTTRLFNYSGGVHYIDGREIIATSLKK